MGLENSAGGQHINAKVHFVNPESAEDVVNSSGHFA
jgi:hypothetical protein